MSDKEKTIVEKLAEVLPTMTERERGYLEGFVTMAAMSGRNKKKEKETVVQ